MGVWLILAVIAMFAAFGPLVGFLAMIVALFALASRA